MLDHLVPPPEGLSFPDGAEVAILRASDGIQLRAVFFQPRLRPCRGTIIVLQGRAEYLEKYGEVFARLLESGFAVAALDWRGQGGSERQLDNVSKGHVEDFDDYLLDHDALLAEAERRRMPEPFGLLSHSAGSAVALLVLARGTTPYARAVLSSPLVAIAGSAGKIGSRILARVLTSIGFSGHFVPTGGPHSILKKPFKGNPLTSDPVRFAKAGKWLAAEPELGIGDPTIGWVDAAFEAMANFSEENFGQANRTPVLMVIAGADTVVSPRASAELAHRMRGASAMTLPGARHEILMERDPFQTEFWAAFDAFMHLGPPAAEVQPVETKAEKLKSEEPEIEKPKTGEAPREISKRKPRRKPVSA
jgi:lysophospholipase